MNSGDSTFDRPASAASRRPRLRHIVLLSLLMLALRLPLLDHPTPVDIDEDNFINALGFPAQYPVHHPGYPLWVAMGSLLHVFGVPQYTSYQAWSIIASVAGPVLLYVGLRWVMHSGLAWWLAAAFGMSPLVWFQGTTALSYCAGGTVGLVVVGLCYRALIGGRPAALYWAAAVLAVGTSLRADLLIYLGPMLAYLAWRFRWRQGLCAMAIVGGGFTMFLVVTSSLYGRADPATVQPNLGHTIDVVFGTSVFQLGLADGLLRNGVKIGVNIGWNLGVGMVLLPPAVWVVVRHRRDWPPSLTTFLLLWAVPIGGFLLLMHVVQGYFMLLLPVGYCVIGLALQSMFKSTTASRVALVIALCSMAQFGFYPWSARSMGFKRLIDAKIAFLSASGLRQINQRAEIHTPGDYWRTKAHEE